MMLRYWRTAASFRYFGFVGFFKYPELTEPFTKSAPALRAAACITESVLATELITIWFGRSSTPSQSRSPGRSGWASST